MTIIKEYDRTRRKLYGTQGSLAAFLCSVHGWNRSDMLWNTLYRYTVGRQDFWYVKGLTFEYVECSQIARVADSSAYWQLHFLQAIPLTCSTLYNNCFSCSAINVHWNQRLSFDLCMYLEWKISMADWTTWGWCIWVRF